MYEIHIESEEFREKRTVQQHQMVNEVRGTWGGCVHCTAAGHSGVCGHLVLMCCLYSSTTVLWFSTTDDVYSTTAACPPSKNHSVSAIVCAALAEDALPVAGHCVYVCAHSQCCTKVLCTHIHSAACDMLCLVVYDSITLPPHPHPGKCSPFSPLPSKPSVAFPLNQ